MKTKELESDRQERRRKFKKWRIEEGRKINADKRPLSYQQIADACNAKAGVPSLVKQPTVTAWGVRGHQPKGEVANILKATFANCPIV